MNNSLELLEIIICPLCYENLLKTKNYFRCFNCQRKYKINQMIPQLLPERLSDDVVFSKEKWEEIHESEEIKRNLRKDSTIKSYYKFLLPYREEIEKGIFLDLGCGVAFLSRLLAEEGIKVVGIDISQTALIKSSLLFRRRKLAGLFLRGDLLHLPLKKETINFIYSCMSLEYVRDTQKAIEEAYRVLVFGGKMVAIVPVISLTTLSYHQLRGDIPNLPLVRPLAEWLHLKIFKGKTLHYGYEQSFTPSLLRKLFQKAGFKVKIIDFCNIYYPIAFLPRRVRPLVRKLLRFRVFWPLVYIEAEKII